MARSPWMSGRKAVVADEADVADEAGEADDGAVADEAGAAGRAWIRGRIPGRAWGSGRRFGGGTMVVCGRPVVAATVFVRAPAVRAGIRPPLGEAGSGDRGVGGRAGGSVVGTGRGARSTRSCGSAEGPGPFPVS